DHQARQRGPRPEGADDHPAQAAPLHREPARRRRHRDADKEVQVGPAPGRDPCSRYSHGRAFHGSSEPDALTRIRLAYRRAIRWVVESRRLLRSVAIAVAIFVAALLFTQWWDFTVPAVGHARYQAVFLTNGQTYFGRYYDRIGAYAKIEDVYYLQQVASSDPNAAPDTRILRRGRELHEPAPRMLIPK